jgi:hypothetical protein
MVDAYSVHGNVIMKMTAEMVQMNWTVTILHALKKSSHAPTIGVYPCHRYGSSAFYELSSDELDCNYSACAKEVHMRQPSVYTHFTGTIVLLSHSFSL